MSADIATADRAMTPAELRDALQLTQATFYRYQAAGKFARFELDPRIGPHRYSRSKVRAHLDLESTVKGPARPVLVDRKRGVR